MKMPAASAQDPTAQVEIWTYGDRFSIEGAGFLPDFNVKVDGSSLVIRITLEINDETKCKVSVVIKNADKILNLDTVKDDISEGPSEYIDPVHGPIYQFNQHWINKLNLSDHTCEATIDTMLNTISLSGHIEGGFIFPKRWLKAV